jgi:predicted RNA polymerase sigma factor
LPKRRPISTSGCINWPEIVLLYEGLVQIAPGIGSLVGRAVAHAQAGKPAAGFATLEEIPASRIVNYQPYWAARGHLLQLLNQKDEAQKAFTRAASLTDDRRCVNTFSSVLPATFENETIRKNP